jgi:hypothetical protein
MLVRDLILEGRDSYFHVSRVSLVVCFLSTFRLLLLFICYGRNCQLTSVVRSVGVAKMSLNLLLFSRIVLFIFPSFFQLGNSGILSPGMELSLVKTFMGLMTRSRPRVTCYACLPSCRKFFTDCISHSLTSCSPRPYTAVRLFALDRIFINCVCSFIVTSLDV